MSDLLICGTLTIHNGATDFDCIFFWSLAIWILTIYHGYSWFRFAVRNRMHLMESIDLSKKGVALCDLQD